MFNLDIIETMPDIDEPVFDSPQGSLWIVSVDDCGDVAILRRPNIHYSFFDNGSSPEDVGLPATSDEPAGVYEWTCSYWTSTDWESGMVDDWGFDVEAERALYLLEEKEDGDQGLQEKTTPTIH